MAGSGIESGGIDTPFFLYETGRLFSAKPALLYPAILGQLSVFRTAPYLLSHDSQQRALWKWKTP